MDQDESLLAQVICLDDSNVSNILLWENFQPLLEKKLPLRSLQWRSRDKVVILNNIYLNFKSFDEVTGIKSELTQENLHESPYFNLILVQCTNIESYRASIRPTLLEYKEKADKDQRYNKLVVYLSSKEDNDKINFMSKYNKTIYDRITSDFYMEKPGDRSCSMRVLPSSISSISRVSNGLLDGNGIRENSNDKWIEPSEKQWSIFLNKCSDCILYSINTRVERINEQLQAMLIAENTPVWNYCSYFTIKEGLSLLYQQISMLDLALIQYDELESKFLSLHQVELESLVASPTILRRLKKRLSSRDDKCISLGLGMHLGEVSSIEKDDIIPFLNPNAKPYRMKIYQNKISMKDFQIYLFARQANILMKLGKGLELSVRGLVFFERILNHIKTSSVSSEEELTISSWCYGAISALLKQCDELQYNDTDDELVSDSNVSIINAALHKSIMRRCKGLTYAAVKGDLIKLVIRKIERIGTYVEIFDNNNNNNNSILTSQISVDSSTNQYDSISTSKLHTAMMYIANEDICEALNSFDKWDDLYRSIVLQAISFYTKAGRKRFTIKYKFKLAIYCFNNNHLDDALALFFNICSSVEGSVWKYIYFHSKMYLGRCYRRLNDHSRYIETYIDILLTYYGLFKDDIIHFRNHNNNNNNNNVRSLLPLLDIVIVCIRELEAQRNIFKESMKKVGNVENTESNMYEVSAVQIVRPLSPLFEITEITRNLVSAQEVVIIENDIISFTLKIHSNLPSALTVDCICIQLEKKSEMSVDIEAGDRKANSSNNNNNINNNSNSSSRKREDNDDSVPSLSSRRSSHGVSDSLYPMVWGSSKEYSKEISLNPGDNSVTISVLAEEIGVYNIDAIWIKMGNLGLCDNNINLAPSNRKTIIVEPLSKAVVLRVNTPPITVAHAIQRIPIELSLVRPLPPDTVVIIQLNDNCNNNDSISFTNTIRLVDDAVEIDSNNNSNNNNDSDNNNNHNTSNMSADVGEKILTRIAKTKSKPNLDDIPLCKFVYSVSDSSKIAICVENLSLEYGCFNIYLPLQLPLIHRTLNLSLVTSVARSEVKLDSNINKETISHSTSSSRRIPSNENYLFRSKCEINNSSDSYSIYRIFNENTVTNSKLLSCSPLAVESCTFSRVRKHLYQHEQKSSSNECVSCFIQMLIRCKSPIPVQITSQKLHLPDGFVIAQPTDTENNITSSSSHRNNNTFTGATGTDLELDQDNGAVLLNPNQRYFNFFEVNIHQQDNVTEPREYEKERIEKCFLELRYQLISNSLPPPFTATRSSSTYSHDSNINNNNNKSISNLTDGDFNHNDSKVCIKQEIFALIHPLDELLRFRSTKHQKFMVEVSCDNDDGEIQLLGTTPATFTVNISILLGAAVTKEHIESFLQPYLCDIIVESNQWLLSGQRRFNLDTLYRVDQDNTPPPPPPPPPPPNTSSTSSSATTSITENTLLLHIPTFDVKLLPVACGLLSYPTIRILNRNTNRSDGVNDAITYTSDQGRQILVYPSQRFSTAVEEVQL